MARWNRAGTWLIDGFILTVWVVMVGLAVSTEHGLWGPPITFRQGMGDVYAMQEQWCGVYYQGRKLGFTHLMLVPDELDGVPGYRITDRGRLYFSLLGGKPELIEVRTQAFIDSNRRLTTFVATVKAQHSTLRIAGRREGDELIVTMTGPMAPVTERIRDPGGRIWVSGLSSWAAFHDLRVGQRGKLWVINPLVLKPEPVSFTVEGTDSIDGEQVLVITSDYRGMTATTWMTPDGVILKETSPLGWELVREPMERALAMEMQGASPMDLLSTVAVAIDQPLEDPEGLRRLTVRMEGVDPEAFRVNRVPWQTLLHDTGGPDTDGAAREGPWVTLRLERAITPGTGLLAELGPSGGDGKVGDAWPESLQRYREASLFVQSDDPAIRGQAQAIVGALTDPWSQAVAVHHWVYESLTKRLTVGFPSATDVLVTKSGDCHEHTVLYTALTRSLGIPTRMVAGLVYYGDRFYYHAWPEVWWPLSEATARSIGVTSKTAPGQPGMGVWIPLDPTVGQPVADVTHIGLVEAEGDGLVQLAQFVGQIRLRVLEMQR